MWNVKLKCETISKENIIMTYDFEMSYSKLPKT